MGEQPYCLLGSSSETFQQHCHCADWWPGEATRQPSWRRRRPKPRTSYVGTALNKETGIDRENSLSNGVLAAAQEGQGGALPGLRRSVHGHITT
jgi:hypothetical protein